MIHFHRLLMFFTHPTAIVTSRPLRSEDLAYEGQFSQFLFLPACTGFFLYCHGISQYILHSSVWACFAHTPINHSQLFRCKFPLRRAEWEESKLIFADNWYFLICGVFAKQLSESGESRANGGDKRSDWNKTRRDGGGRCRLTSSLQNGCCRPIKALGFQTELIHRGK